VAEPYADLDWQTWERVVGIWSQQAAMPLKTYDRFRQDRAFPDGVWRARNDDVRSRHRMNIGVIIESPMISVRMVSFYKGADADERLMRPGRKLGEMEEYFFEMLTPGDTFLFAGEILRFEGISDTDALVTKTYDPDPAIPSYNGGKVPLTTLLADRVRRILFDRDNWKKLPDQVREWIEVQERKSIIPSADQLLVETFPRGDRHYLVCYPFEGRLAHRTLGMLLTRRLERTGLKPLGFVASEYALSVWALEDMRGEDMDYLFAEDMLGDDLDAWMEESALMKRTSATTRRSRA